MNKSFDNGGVIWGGLPPARDLPTPAKDELRHVLRNEKVVRRGYLTWISCRDGDEKPHELVRDIVRDPTTGRMEFRLVKFTGASGFQIGVELDEGVDCNGTEVMMLTRRVNDSVKPWVSHGVIIVNNLSACFGEKVRDAYFEVSECFFQREK